MIVLFPDLIEEDFVEILPPGRHPPKEMVALSMVHFGNAETERVQIKISGAIFKEIGGERCNIAYAARQKLLRLTVHPKGTYGAGRIGRSDFRIFRCHLPPGFAFSKISTVSEFYVDHDNGAILIRVPDSFLDPALQPLAAPAPKFDQAPYRREPAKQPAAKATPTPPATASAPTMSQTVAERAALAPASPAKSKNASALGPFLEHRKSKATAVVTSELMGDPPPGRSALASKGGQ